MKLIYKVVLTSFIILNLNGFVYAQQVLRPEELTELKQVAHEVLIKGDAPTPEKVISVLRYLNMVSKGTGDPELTKVLAERGAIQLGVGILMDTAIDIMVENMKTRGIIKPEDVIDEHVVKLWMKTAKNMVLGDIVGELINVGSITAASWQDTTKVLDSLPPIQELPPKEQEYVKDIYTAKELMEGNLLMKIKALGLAFEEGIKRITNTSTQQAVEFPNILSTSLSTIPITSDLAKTVSDQQVSLNSSTQAAYTPQSLVNTKNVYYTENIVGSWLGLTSYPQTSGSPYTETLNFYRGGTFINTSDQGGQYSGTYSIDTTATPTSLLEFTVTSTNNGAGTFNAPGDYSRYVGVSGSTMTLTCDPAPDNLMYGSYKKQ